jgi:2,3-bisphosphoglycerate-independent phosphoglycerate mutase
VSEKVPRELERKRKIKGLPLVMMTRYEKDLPGEVAFPPVQVEKGLGETIFKQGLKQLRLAETEKYAHVTYFFNGGIEKPFPGEDRQVIPSPRVESYAKAPAMSAKGIADKAVSGIRSGKYSFILINFANADMVGHTGNIKAAKKGIETVDACLSRIYGELEKQNGILLITADHGNADSMLDDESGEIIKEHSYSPVPFIVVHPDFRQNNKGRFYLEKVKGALANVAPTVLKLLGIAKPEEMSGKSLI